MVGGDLHLDCVGLVLRHGLFPVLFPALRLPSPSLLLGLFVPLSGSALSVFAYLAGEVVNELLLPEVFVLFGRKAAVCGKRSSGLVAEVKERRADGTGRVGVPGGTVVHHLFLFDEWDYHIPMG